METSQPNLVLSRKSPASWVSRSSLLVFRHILIQLYVQKNLKYPRGPQTWTGRLGYLDEWHRGVDTEGSDAVTKTHSGLCQCCTVTYCSLVFSFTVSVLTERENASVYSQHQLLLFFSFLSHCISPESPWRDNSHHSSFPGVGFNALATETSKSCSLFWITRLAQTWNFLSDSTKARTQFFTCPKAVCHPGLWLTSQGWLQRCRSSALTQRGTPRMLEPSKQSGDSNRSYWWSRQEPGTEGVGEDPRWRCSGPLTPISSLRALTSGSQWAFLRQLTILCYCFPYSSLSSELAVMSARSRRKKYFKSN